jgi:hypothetical protein
VDARREYTSRRAIGGVGVDEASPAGSDVGVVASGIARRRISCHSERERIFTTPHKAMRARLTLGSIGGLVLSTPNQAARDASVAWGPAQGFNLQCAQCLSLFAFVSTQSYSTIKQCAGVNALLDAEG